MLGWLARAWREGLSPWVGLRDGPRTGPAGRTDIPGLYVVGDLAGAPLLKLAIQQGTEAGEALAAAPDTAAGPDTDVDVAIVGGGPAGIAAALPLLDAGRTVAVLERHAAFRTIDAFPAGKIIYAEPPALRLPDTLAFDDAPKETLVDTWRRRVAERDVPVRQGVEVVDVRRTDAGFRLTTRAGGEPGLLSARKVVLALGRRGTPRTLGVPGEDLPHVATCLVDAAEHAGQDVVVVGGGDSAVEAASQLAAAGARVTLVHRRERLDRPKPRNTDLLQGWIDDGRVTLRTLSRIRQIDAQTVVLDTPEGALTTPAQAVLLLLGTDPPLPFLRRVGLQVRSRIPWSDAAWISVFVAMVWCFYVLKYHKPWFPFSPSSAGWVHDALTVPAPWLPTADGSVRVLDAGFWGTVLYSLAILGFGLAAMRRYRSPTQTRRYLSLIGFQWVFLFGVPELVAPAITTAASQWYTLSVPWPLSIESLAKSPDVPAAGLWLLLGAFVSFVALPLYVRRHNERFCSWMCGCGGLAETVGDLWRWRSPRGDLARKAEGAGRLVFLAAVPVTALILADAWQLVGWRTLLDDTIVVQDGRVIFEAAPEPVDEDAMRVTSARVQDGSLWFEIDKRDWDGSLRRTGWTSGVQAGDRTIYPDKIEEGLYRLDLSRVPDGPLHVVAGRSALSNARHFARSWYALVVDFSLASFLGVALYPLLGNRVWCRFFCPLRAYMEWIATRWGRLAIVADDRCISCGECTTWCQMGIDVQGFAEKGRVLDNATSACIQCGICVEVCPMDVLSLVDKPSAGVADGVPGLSGPRWG